MREEFSFPSADGRTQIHGVRWVPEGEPRFVLQMVHGMVEFIDRYDAFARWLNEHGVVAVGHDHLGHGDSVTDREEWGYMGDRHPSDILVEDMYAVHNRIRREYPGLPRFILGHSMGSYLLRKYLTRHGEGLAGAIVMGTGDVPGAVAGLGGVLCTLTGKTRGWHHRSPALAKLAMGGGAYKQFDATGKEPERSWLTRDPEIVRAYYREPRCTFLFTASGYKALMEAVAFDARPANIGKIPHDLPILLVSGDRDPVGDLGEGVKRVERKMKQAGLTDVTLKLWPECRHEVLNELNRGEVYEDLLRWMEAKLP